MILDELTVVANSDACVSESLNKNDHGEAVCLNSGNNAVGAEDVSPRVGGIQALDGTELRAVLVFYCEETP